MKEAKAQAHITNTASKCVTNRVCQAFGPVFRRIYVPTRQLSLRMCRRHADLYVLTMTPCITTPSSLVDAVYIDVSHHLGESF